MFQLLGDFSRALFLTSFVELVRNDRSGVCALRAKCKKDEIPDKDLIKSDFGDNLIIEAFREYRPKNKDGTHQNKTRRYSMGIFPAIPVRVVAAKNLID